MAGTLTEDNMTHNKISVTWQLSPQRTINEIDRVISSPFSLSTDGTVILFSLVIDLSSKSTEYRVMITHNLQEAVRAILTLSVVDIILRTDLNGCWERNHEFNCPGLSCRTLRYSGVMIKCDITWLGFAKSGNIPKSTQIPKELCLQRIPYTNELKPDVKLIMEGKELPAHKNILALHSPVFLGMFDAPMKESMENRVIIEDVEFSTMQTLLEIIYSGETDQLHNVELALKILAAAEKYQMITIKTACEYKLQLNINRSNVLEILDASDKYNAAKLLELCVEYLISARSVSPETLQKMCLESPKLSAALITTQMKKLWSVPSKITGYRY